MNDQELAELRKQEIELNKLCDVAKKEHDAAVDRWWQVSEAIKAEKQYRKIKAQVLKEQAQANLERGLDVAYNIKTMLEVQR